MALFQVDISREACSYKKPFTALKVSRVARSVAFLGSAADFGRVGTPLAKRRKEHGGKEHGGEVHGGEVHGGEVHGAKYMVAMSCYPQMGSWPKPRPSTGLRPPRIGPCCIFPVVCRITRDTSQLSSCCLDDREASVGVVARAFGHDSRQYRPAPIDTYMELAPPSLSTLSVLCRGPFALPHDRKPRAIDDQVYRMLESQKAKIDVQTLASSRQRRVVRGFEGQIHGAEQGTREAFILVQRQAENESQGQSRFDSQIGELL
ncbi:MAG: hypothetical protein ACI82F_003113 [Planctomycetota bacterium]